MRSAVPLIIAFVAVAAGSADGQGRALAGPALGRIPLHFVENRGVHPAEVAYYTAGAGRTLFFTGQGVTFVLAEGDRGWAVELSFPGASPEARPRGRERRAAVFSYFKGKPEHWKTGLPSFGKVVYADLWPGIDLVYEASTGGLKYELIVQPGADPGRVRLRYRGGEVRLLEGGGLRVETPAGRIEDAPPVAYQLVGGERLPVESSFVLEPEPEGGTFGFRLGPYDESRPLIIDPVLFVYSGFIGGDYYDEAYGIAVDAAGNAYVTGQTDSTSATFPVTVGPYRKLSAGGWDAFVAKVKADGTGLEYCGYIGGDWMDIGDDVAVDASGNAYVIGHTNSDQSTFPVTVGPDLTYNWGVMDAFVAKVNSAGTRLEFCGYLGGNGDEVTGSIALDTSGFVYVVGDTTSTEGTFPVTVGPDLTYNSGPGDAFVAKIHPSGRSIVYCGYIGGSGTETGRGIAVDSGGNAYVCGEIWIGGSGLPVTVGPDLTFNGGYRDAWVAKVDASGRGLVYCGYIGGLDQEVAYGVAVDASGSAYVAGWTLSDEKSFPVTVGPDLTYNGPSTTPHWVGDAFVAKVKASGAGLEYCGYIGGNAEEEAWDVAVDGAGCAYLTGFTRSPGWSFPVKDGPDLTYNGGNMDAFVAKVKAAGSALEWCGYVGGSSYLEYGEGIALDPSGNVYLGGWTYSNEGTFPVKVGPDLTQNGRTDGFVAKLAQTVLDGKGPTRPGDTVRLTLTASDSVALPYQAGTSLGTGPIPIDRRKLGLGLDLLLEISVGGYWPGVFDGYRGLIDARGQAPAAIHIPRMQMLVGLTLHTAFVTLSPSAPSGVHAISNTFSFTITRS